MSTSMIDPRERAFPVRFLKVAESSRAYGVSCETLRALVREKKLRAFKPTGRRGIFLSVDELEALFAASASK